MDTSPYKDKLLGFYKGNKIIAIVIVVLLLLAGFLLAYKLDNPQTTSAPQEDQKYNDNNTSTPPIPPIPEKISKKTENEKKSVNTGDFPESKETQNNDDDSTENESETDDSADNTNSGGDSDSEDNVPTPTPEEPESLSSFVAFYSDNQSDTDAEDARHQKVVDKIMASGANPIFHAGDLMEDGTQNSMDRFLSVAGSMLASRSFYGALGNNDRKIGDSSTPSSIYLDYFNFPGNERWYSINSGNLHLVVLDSAFASASAEQLSWLESDLQSSASRDRITGIVFHHPSFATTISSYMINNHVDFVIYGHGHTYVKTLVDGIYQFMLPGGGSLGYALGSVYESYINLRFYNSDGGLIGSQIVSDR